MKDNFSDVETKRRLGIIAAGAGGRIEVQTRSLAIPAEEAAELLRKQWQWITSATPADGVIEVHYKQSFEVETIRQVITNALRYKLVQTQ